ncbi:MAG: acyloxyacyl hydrolase [Alphaproteobacteria bacterium]
MRGRSVAVALVGLLLALGTAREASADDPSFLTMGAGIFDVFDDDTAGYFRLEYRSDARLLSFIKPLVGISISTDGAVYGYGGFNIDLYFGRRWVFSPGFAVGAFEEGDGKDLGNTVEFRSGAEIAYRFANRARLGLAFHHISNASLSDRNPGANVLVLTYSLPFGYVFASP